MKKIILSLAVLAGAAGAANAQTGVKYGLKGGFNGSSYTGSNTKGLDYKAGFAAGVFLNFGLSDNFSVQPEFLYSQKGASQDDVSYGTPAINVTRKDALGYLDVPLMFRYNVGEDGKGFFVELGPQGSFILHRRQFVEDGSGKEISGSRVTTTDPLNKAILGYVGGVGYQITSGVQLGVRYTGDFMRINKDSNNDFRNSVFQFQVGYAFGGK
ncbi:porin family protein [Hymenobacter bucti]|uniref:Porin family protein n=1 Tax=Hymenobacter bucti TaxID=1844114 RepID=A0ABW4QQV7_9BACT